MCPQCGSEKFEEIFEEDIQGSDERFTVYECEDCGHQDF